MQQFLRNVLFTLSFLLHVGKTTRDARTIFLNGDKLVV